MSDINNESYTDLTQERKIGKECQETGTDKASSVVDVLGASDAWRSSRRQLLRGQGELRVCEDIIRSYVIRHDTTHRHRGSYSSSKKLDELILTILG